MDTQVAELLERARQAQANAHAPYSHFRVGAALVTASGKYYSGANVENASYGLTVCAERSAIFQMVGAGEREIAALLVVGDCDDFLPPCGACRQVIAEFAAPATPVFMCRRDGAYQRTTVAELMPHVFRLLK